MWQYIAKRLALMIPTLFGIMLINFLIIQIAPGGPVEQMIALLTGHSHAGADRFSSKGQQEAAAVTPVSLGEQSRYRGAQGLDPEIIKEIEKMYGFDKPAWRRFTDMIISYATFDFGESFFRNATVWELLIEKMPVSFSLGIWTTLLIYLISIPLGIRKAVKDGSSFDMVTSSIIVIAYAIPSFLFAILLIVLFAGGSFWSIFPLRGIISDDWHSFSWPHIALDYLWHMCLPVIAMTIGGFAGLTMLTKNSFLEEIHKQYVLTARAKGLPERRVLYGHVFRNAMLLVISGLPEAILAVFFTGSFLIEIIFSLDGLGLLSFEAVIQRDYPVMFGTLYFFTLLGLIFRLFGDLTYTWVDPRIDFESYHR